jgi:hypothetical protein
MATPESRFEERYKADRLRELDPEHAAIYRDLRLIRFRGHFPKGGYDVHTDGEDSSKPAPASAI